MPRSGLFGFSVALALSLAPLASFAQTATGAPPARDWTTWGYDQERSGWNTAEATLSKDNVSRLELKWTAQLSTPPI